MPSARSSLLAGVSIRRNQCRRLLVENAEFVDVTDNSAVELTRDRAGQRWRSRHREILSRMVRETGPPTDSLPRMQRLTEVWRLRDPGERDASVALRSARGNRLRKAIGWYRTHDRLHTGNPIAMAADATAAYIKARAEGKDAAILCDTWEVADAINQRLHDRFTDPDVPSVAVARDQKVRAGDIIVSRHNDAGLTVAPGGSPPSGSPIRPALSSKVTTCASTSPSATQPPCTPPKA